MADLIPTGSFIQHAEVVVMGLQVCRVRMLCVGSQKFAYLVSFAKDVLSLMTVEDHHMGKGQTTAGLQRL